MQKNERIERNNIPEHTETPNAMSLNKKVCVQSKWKFTQKQDHFNSQSDMEKPIKNALIRK